MFEKYPNIEQFRNVIRNVKSAAQYVGKDRNGDAIYDPLKSLPILKYEGTVKIHGTNFAYVFNKETGEEWLQSRERIITLEQDNAGAARLLDGKDFSFVKQIPGNLICIYAEFAGRGIHKGVAVSQLEKRFIIFDIKVDDKWLPREEVAKIKDESISVYNIYDFPTYEIEIDFSKPDESQNKLIELTTQVADCCPVGARFGVEGIGEGIVWRCITPGWESSKFWMKVKDERHQNSKVKTLNPVDGEKNAALRVIADKVTPPWRLEQMLSEACNLVNGGQIDRKHLGDYLRLVSQDIIKEDSDLLEGFEIKEVMKFASQKAREYFFIKENEH